jgi:hypothetical protein
MVFAGFTFVLYGLAAALSPVFPRWLGWIAVAGGAGGAVSGVVQAYIGEPSAVTTALGIAAPTIITPVALDHGDPAGAARAAAALRQQRQRGRRGNDGNKTQSQGRGVAVNHGLDRGPKTNRELGASPT